jgi:carboxylesterase type B
MISPQSKGLFSSAIVESNPVALNLNTAEIQGQYSALFAKYAGCGDMSGIALSVCLLNLTIDQVLDAQTKVGYDVNPAAPIYIFYPWTPTIDGNNVPGQPVNLFPKGAFNRVPFILGNVHDEAWMFIWEVQPLPVPSVEYYAILVALFGDNAPAVEKLYPVSPFDKDTRPQLNNVITDYLFICPGRWLVQNARRNVPNLPIYHYEFNHVISFYESWGANYSFCWFDYVCHASELPFVFDSATIGGFTYEPEEQALALDLVSYWGNFANTGNPNIGPAKVDFTWPMYDNDALLSMNLNLTLGTITDLRGEYCDY